MTEAILLTSENILKAKEEIIPLAQEFLKIEPHNSMAIAETRQGAIMAEKAVSRLEAKGYSPEDAQLLFSEVVEKLCED